MGSGSGSRPYFVIDPASLLGEQDTFAKKVGSSAAEHLSFQHLQTVDVALDDAAAPGQREPGGDRVLVTGAGPARRTATSAGRWRRQRSSILPSPRRPGSTSWWRSCGRGWPTRSGWAGGEDRIQSLLAVSVDGRGVAVGPGSVGTTSIPLPRTDTAQNWRRLGWPPPPRPPTVAALAKLVVRLTQENSRWGHAESKVNWPGWGFGSRHQTWTSIYW